MYITPNIVPKTKNDDVKKKKIITGYNIVEAARLVRRYAKNVKLIEAILHMRNKLFDLASPNFLNIITCLERLRIVEKIDEMTKASDRNTVVIVI